MDERKFHRPKKKSRHGKRLTKEQRKAEVGRWDGQRPPDETARLYVELFAAGKVQLDGRKIRDPETHGWPVLWVGGGEQAVVDAWHLAVTHELRKYRDVLNHVAAGAVRLLRLRKQISDLQLEADTIERNNTIDCHWLMNPPKNHRKPPGKRGNVWTGEPVDTAPLPLVERAMPALERYEGLLQLCRENPEIFCMLHPADHDAPGIRELLSAEQHAACAAEAARMSELYAQDEAEERAERAEAERQREAWRAQQAENRKKDLEVAEQLRAVKPFLA